MPPSFNAFKCAIRHLQAGTRQKRSARNAVPARHTNHLSIACHGASSSPPNSGSPASIVNLILCLS